MESRVAIMKTDRYCYPNSSSFRPSVAYPEYIFKETAEQKNEIYELVRQGFYLLGYDKDNYNTSRWNPLGWLISPGNTVLIKPNLVMEYNRSGDGTDCLYTQPSVVAPVIDYVLIALKNSGKIVIGDAPMQECKFEELISHSGYDRLINFYNQHVDGVDISLLDFRELKSSVVKGVRHSTITGKKGTTIDLGDQSEFFGESDDFFNNIRITNYDPDLLRAHHTRQRNEYCITQNVLDADVIINMPKPKTHRKAGVTISLKNLVGINVRKEFLPHHTNGSISEGGDEYETSSNVKRIMNMLYDKKNYYAQTRKAYHRAWLYGKTAGFFRRAVEVFYKDKYYEGSWYGNDTISRTIIDLNKILYYADKNGNLCDSVQRKQLIIADMIISGEKEGPVAPSSKDVGVIAIGENPVCFDEAIGVLMGADILRINTLVRARNIKGRYVLVQPAEYPYFISNDMRWNLKRLSDISDADSFNFIPTSGWSEVFNNSKNAKL